MVNVRLKEARKKKGITGRVAAEMLCMPYSTYSKYESGERTPDVKTLSVLANFYDVSTDYLIGHDNYNDDTDEFAWLDDLTADEIAERCFRDFHILFSRSNKSTKEQMRGFYLDTYKRFNS